MKTFKSAATAAEPIEFELDGQTYTFQPGKSSGAILALVQAKGDGKLAEGSRVKALLDWLAVGLHPEHNTDAFRGIPGHEEKVEGCQACVLQAALADPHGTTLEAIMDVINWLISEISARPTGSPSAS